MATREKERREALEKEKETEKDKTGETVVQEDTDKKWL